MFASCLLLLASTVADVHPHYVMIFGHQDRTDGKQPDPKASHSWLTWSRRMTTTTSTRLSPSVGRGFTASSFFMSDARTKP